MHGDAPRESVESFDEIEEMIEMATVSHTTQVRVSEFG